MNKNETGRSPADLVPEVFARALEMRSIRESMPTDRNGINLRWIGDYYWVSWRDLSTPLSVLQWQNHLASKRGATKDVLLIFASIVCEHHGWRQHI